MKNLSKKFLALFLSILTVTSMAGCTKSDTPDANESVHQDITESEVPAQQTQPEGEEAFVPTAPSEVNHTPTELRLGQWDGNSYFNDMLGISCTLPMNWHIEDADALLQANGIVPGEYTSQQEITAVLSDAPAVYDLLSESENGMQTVTIMFHNVWMQYEGQTSCDAFIDQLLVDMTDALDTSETENGSCERIDVDFAGGKYPAIKSQVELINEGGNINLYQLVIFMEAGDYLASITLNTLGEDSIQELSDFFTELT